MGKYLKIFETTSEYEAYIQGGGAIFPNVSMTEDTPTTAYYNPLVIETRVVATFNVTSTSDPTYILGDTANISTVEIDGVEQPSVVSQYAFSTTGEHTVKYTLKNPTSIGSDAFYGCTTLTSITIPSSVTSIGNYAFQNCSGLTSITIPDSVTSIGNQAFSDCESLTSIGGIGSGASVEIPNSVTSIGTSAFISCTGIISITIPDSVISISANVFRNCTSLTSVTIGSGVTSISNGAFSYCRGLTSVTIPDSVTSIGEDAFSECSSLTSITIPSSVTSIGGDVFSHCTGLTSITSNATTAPTIQSYTFANVKTNGTLYVPNGSTGYDTWMGTGNYYLGKYNWTKVEQ